MRLYELCDALEAVHDDESDADNEKRQLLEVQLRNDLDDRMSYHWNACRQLAADHEAVAREAKFWADKKKSLESRLKSRKAYLAWVLAGKKWCSPDGTRAFKFTPSVKCHVDQPELVPEELCKVECRPDVERIKKELLSDEAVMVPGCRLERCLNLQVK